MTSAINPLNPTAGLATTASVRANFASAKSEIEALQSGSIAGLAASSGSSLIGTIQTGAGAVPRTEKDKLNDIWNALDLGIVQDDATDNRAILQALLDKGPNFAFDLNPGISRFASSLTWTKFSVCVYGRVPPGRASLDGGAVFKYTGSGTGLTMGVSPDVNGAFLEDAKIENIKLSLAVNTTIGLRGWHLNGARIRNLFVSGSSGAARVAIQLEGGIDTELDNIDIQGQVGASAVPANYLAVGMKIQNGYLNSVTTTTRVNNSYFHYCVYGVELGADSSVVFNDSIFEANTIGLVIDPNCIVKLNDPWFEANISRAIYFSNNSKTAINGGHFNILTLQDFFSASTPKNITLRSCVFQSSHIAPRFFNPGAESQAGMLLVLDGCTLPAGFTIGSSTITWKNIEVIGMRQATYRFRQTGIAANTSYNMPQASGSANAYKMVEKGHILASYCYYVGATISAGTFDTAVKVNGSAVANLTSGNFATTPGEVDGIQYRDKFSAGDTLQAVVHTSAAFAATGGEFITEVIVAFGEDGM